MSNRRIAFYWLILATFIGFVVVAPMVDYLTRPNYEPEAQRLRETLKSVDTLPEFVAALEAAGMHCKTLPEKAKVIGYCRRTQGLPL